MAPVVFTVLPEKAPPVKYAAFTHPAAVENPVEAVTVVPLMVDPWKVPPVKAAPVNPADAVTVVPLMVDPWKVPPVNPVEAVMVVPL